MTPIFLYSNSKRSSGNAWSGSRTSSRFDDFILNLRQKHFLSFALLYRAGKGSQSHLRKKLIGGAAIGAGAFVGYKVVPDGNVLN